MLRLGSEESAAVAVPGAEDSVYFHPTLNPHGLPPPGKAQQFKTRFNDPLAAAHLHKPQPAPLLPPPLPPMPPMPFMPGMYPMPGMPPPQMMPPHMMGMPQQQLPPAPREENEFSEDELEAAAAAREGGSDESDDDDDNERGEATASEATASEAAPPAAGVPPAGVPPAGVPPPPPLRPSQLDSEGTPTSVLLVWSVLHCYDNWCARS